MCFKEGRGGLISVLNDVNWRTKQRLNVLCLSFLLITLTPLPLPVEVGSLKEEVNDSLDQRGTITKELHLDCAMWNIYRSKQRLYRKPRVHYHITGLKHSWGHQTSSGSFQVQPQTGIEYFAAQFARDELRKLAVHWWLLRVKWQQRNPARSIMFLSCTP